ncbi:hypothetical protein XPA_008911 [Xanthoria parietina]
MRPRPLARFSHIPIFIILLFAFQAHSAPSSRQQLSAFQIPPISEPVTRTIDVRKRTEFLRHTLANGWVIHYQVISVIYPIFSSWRELQTLYNAVLSEVARRSSAGGLTGPVETWTFGKVQLSFRAERGYSPSVGWDIVTAFAEQLLQGQLPMTFTCHIAPPESDVGIQVELTVLV